jgi:hypothetical protein
LDLALRAACILTFSALPPLPRLQAGSSNGAAAPAAQAEEAGRGVAVVAEVLEDGGGTQSGEFVEAEVSESESESSQQHQQQQHNAGSSTSAAAGNGGGKGKKGKKGKK